MAASLAALGAQLVGNLAPSGLVSYSDRYEADFSKEDHNLMHLPRVEARVGF
jgi:hypothetical protein